MPRQRCICSSASASSALPGRARGDRGIATAHAQAHRPGACVGRRYPCPSRHLGTGDRSLGAELRHPGPLRTSTRLVLVHYGGDRQLGLILEQATDTLRCRPDEFQPYGLDNADAPYLGPVRQDAWGCCSGSRWTTCCRTMSAICCSPSRQGRCRHDRTALLPFPAGAHRPGRRVGRRAHGRTCLAPALRCRAGRWPGRLLVAPAAIGQ